MRTHYPFSPGEASASDLYYGMHRRLHSAGARRVGAAPRPIPTVLAEDRSGSGNPAPAQALEADRALEQVSAPRFRRARRARACVDSADRDPRRAAALRRSAADRDDAAAGASAARAAAL